MGNTELDDVSMDMEWDIYTNCTRHILVTRAMSETMDCSSSSSPVALNFAEETVVGDEKMITEDVPVAGCSATFVPPRVPSPMITVSDDTEEAAAAPPLPDRVGHLTPTGDRKKSPTSGVAPRQRKRSQPVRGDLLPDPDKLLSYKHHDKKEDEQLEDPTVPGGQPKPPPEPRQPGQAAERKRSTVTFCPVVETIDK